MGVVAGESATHQCPSKEVREWILRFRHLSERPVELYESMVDNGAHELGYPTEVVVDRYRREPACGRDRARLDGGRSLLGQQPDRGLNEPLRHAWRRIPWHVSHASSWLRS